MQMIVILPFTHCSLCSVIDIYIYRCYAVVLDHLPLWAKEMCIYRFIIVNILQQEHLSQFAKPL